MLGRRALSSEVVAAASAVRELTSRERPPVPRVHEGYSEGDEMDTATDVSCPTALAYETTEEACWLLGGGEGELASVRTAVSEAAYYLSDPMEPDDRAELLSLARRRRTSPGHCGEERSSAALRLLSDAAGEVEDMLRGPYACSELRIALRALRGAIRGLASQIASNKVDMTTLGSQRLGVLRGMQTKFR